MLYAYTFDIEGPTAAGVGAYGTPAGGNISVAVLGERERVAPSAVDALKMGSYVLPNEVQFQWAAAQDDPTGSSIYSYVVYRDGQYRGWTRSPVFVDASVAPGTTYSYVFYAIDFHQNWSAPATLQVSTPPAAPSIPAASAYAPPAPTGAPWASKLICSPAT